MTENNSITADFYCDFVLNNKIEVKRIKETNNVLAFYHTKPNWTFHVVIISKQHVASLTDVENMDIIKEVFEVAKEIILENDLHKKNYKIVTNGGGFQDSKHLHFHLISGKNITESS